ncbi:MAG TPA: response regulator [Steroidobacteraceae bacterium]|nr:response regulator [Steroidobacteraceae bacterium]
MNSLGSILFVEDESLLREMVTEALRDFGYSVQDASDGPEALQFIAGPTHFDALISDVSMPKGVSGIDLARRAKEVRPEIHLVLASGYAKSQLPDIPEDVILLPKPYRIGQLFALLSDLLGGEGTSEEFLNG